jgi:hypothetical protein
LELKPEKIVLDVSNHTEYALDSAMVDIDVFTKDGAVSFGLFSVELTEKNGYSMGLFSSTMPNGLAPGKSLRVEHSPRNQSVESKAFRQDRIARAGFLTVKERFLSFRTPPGRGAAMTHSDTSGFCLMRRLQLEVAVPDELLDDNAEISGHPIADFNDPPSSLLKRMSYDVKRVMRVHDIERARGQVRHWRHLTTQAPGSPLVECA